MLTVNTNVTSLNAQRNLNSSQSALSTSLERLSSGLRINSAKDDAAGLAISNKMTAQIRGIGQAVRNANDGISVAQTAEGGLNQVGDMLQRMRELAVQAANGSNSDDDRKTIQNEIGQLYQEIDRISGATEFNGQKLFSGSDAQSAKSFQVGANAGQTISYNIGEVSTKTLGLNTSIPDGQLHSGRITAGVASGGDLVINGKQIDFATTDNSIGEFKAAINAKSAQTGVTASAFNQVEGAAANVSSSNVVTGLTITVGGADGAAGSLVTINNSASLDELVANINTQMGGAVTASIGDKGNLVLANSTGGKITIGGTPEGSGLKTGSYEGFLAFESKDGGQIDIGVAAGGSPSALAKFGLNQGSGNDQVTSNSKISSVTTTHALAVTALGSKYDPTANASDVVKLNGVQVGKANSGSAADMAAAINAVADQSGVTAAASTTAYVKLDFGDAGKLTINGQQIDTSGATDLTGVAKIINDSNATGVVAETDASTGLLVLKSATGADITVGNDGTNIFATEVADNSTLAGAAAAAAAATDFVGVRGSLSLTGKDGTAVRIEGEQAALDKFGLQAQNSDGKVTGAGLDVSTVDGANAALKAIDKAIGMVDTKRSELGAVQNRFSSTISNLQTSSENLSASRSRIQDADFAAETAQLSRNQILQQAGTAMLAQANQLPQQVMQLLR